MAGAYLARNGPFSGGGLWQEAFRKRRLSDAAFGTRYWTTVSRDCVGFGRSVALGCVAQRDGAVERRAAHREGLRYFAGTLVAGRELSFGDCRSGFSHEGSAATDTSERAAFMAGLFLVLDVLLDMPMD